MLEYLYQRTFVDFIKEGTLPSEMPEEELKTRLKINATKSVDIDTLDVLYKNLIDELIENYGFLKSLALITTFKEDATDLLPKYRFTRLGGDLGLLVSAANILYRKVEAFYKPNLYYKMYLFLWKLHTGTFDEVEFFREIETTSVNIPVLLGKSDADSLPQESIFDGETTEREEPMAPIRWSLKRRERDIKELQRRIRATYTKEEIQIYFADLIDKLTCNPTIEHLVIIKSIFKIEEEIDKQPLKRQKTNPEQQTLF